MAANGNELVKLSQLKLVVDDTATKLAAKLNKPAGNGTDGQVLVTDGAGGTRWEDQSQVDTGSIADNAITTGKIADGAVTESKIADGAVTTNKVGAGAITTEKIADDAITADKIADGVIPTVPTNVSAFTNDADYQTGTEVTETVNAAVQAAVSAVYKYKGTVANQGALPSEPAPAVGDVYNVEDTGMNYAWNGTAWDALGSVTTLTSLGVTATATELNYVKGVTSNVQEQINAINEAIPDEYTLPVAGAALGGVKNGGDIEVAADGAMNIGAAKVTADKIAGGINVSKFTNDAGYLTAGTLPFASDEDFKTFMGLTA